MKKANRQLELFLAKKSLKIKSKFLPTNQLSFYKDYYLDFQNTIITK